MELNPTNIVIVSMSECERKSSKIIGIARFDQEKCMSIHIYDLLQRELRDIPRRSRYDYGTIETFSRTWRNRDLVRERNL